MRKRKSRKRSSDLDSRIKRLNGAKVAKAELIEEKKKKEEKDRKNQEAVSG